MREIIKNVAHLEHPEPLEIMTKAIANLRDNEYIKMIHRKEPLPLYEILKANGFFYHTISAESSGDFRAKSVESKIKSADFVESKLDLVESAKSIKFELDSAESTEYKSSKPVESALKSNSICLENGELFHIFITKESNKEKLLQLLPNL
ncbi:hypothetical protein CCY99_08370 [Helicobacter sp. 16-1353]|uniref:DUF2249 domain-containing protein n=1 Tax=Helicobacter sp. 16-1353 TaxID=2004996 RepID=UPI000DCEDD2E|nr:DUF2249 domain-containing protein [Helicobacter sp. 16-1353]RAX51805.1 hypothetical protein CCY99_08370 [Helicobacter sp. 16-1353]